MHLGAVSRPLLGVWVELGTVVIFGELSVHLLLVEMDCSQLSFIAVNNTHLYISTDPQISAFSLISGIDPLTRTVAMFRYGKKTWATRRSSSLNKMSNRRCRMAGEPKPLLRTLTELMSMKTPSMAVLETICSFLACPLGSPRSSPAPRQVRSRGSRDLLVPQ